MMLYSRYGYREFAVALGYNGAYIKRWMREFSSLHVNMTVQTGTGTVTLHDRHQQDWTVDLVDTGQEKATGGRIKRLQGLDGSGHLHADLG
jgi:glucose-1-phosphate cytidylyltransferase